MARRRNRRPRIASCLAISSICVAGKALAAKQQPKGACDTVTLLDAAKDLLYSNYREEIRGPMTSLQEGVHLASTDALAAAWAMAHFDQLTARQYFRSVLRGQWKSGLIPSARFASGANDTWLPGTLLPGPGSSLWTGTGEATAESAGATAAKSAHGDNTTALAALPLHAFVALQIFDLSERDDAARSWLQEVFPALFRWHDYLHSKRAHAPTGMILALHPWETALPPDAALWQPLLASAAAAAANDSSWVLPNIPEAIKNNPEYPGDQAFDASLYLLRCQAEARAAAPAAAAAMAAAAAAEAASAGKAAAAAGAADSTTSATAAAAAEVAAQAAAAAAATAAVEATAAAAAESGLDSCPFALLDVELNAVLLRSDQALLEAAMLLEQTRSTWQSRPYTPEQYERMQEWAESAGDALAALWDSEVHGFRGRFWENSDSDGTPSNWTAGQRVAASAADLAALLPVGAMATAAADAVAFKLLVASPLAEDSFRCGRYPVVEEACSDVATSSGGGDNGGESSAGGSNGGSDKGSRVWLLHNLLAQRGLDRQGEHGLSRWLTNSSVALVCRSSVVPEAAATLWGSGEAPAPPPSPRGRHRPSIAESSPAEEVSTFAVAAAIKGGNAAGQRSQEAPLFARVFDGTTGIAAADSQGGNSTMAAAATVLLLLPDGPEALDDFPPISHAVMFVIMLVELIFSFGLGLSCFVVSLNLVRRLRVEEPAAMRFAERAASGWGRAADGPATQSDLGSEGGFSAGDGDNKEEASDGGSDRGGGGRQNRQGYRSLGDDEDDESVGGLLSFIRPYMQYLKFY